MLRSLFLSDSRRHPVEFAARAFDLAPRLFQLLAIHLRRRFPQTAAGAMQNGNRHLQIALEPGRLCGGRRRRLPLRFQKQFRLGQNALANHARGLPPGGIELPGLPRVTTVLDESGGHPLAIVQLDARHRHQILHGQAGAKHSFPHLLLDRFRQQFDQRQPPRHPTHAAVEPPRQLIQSIAEALLHLRQQPALFERAFLWTEAQRPLQQQSFGFAHFPDGGFHRVPAQLLERGDALVAVDHHVAVAVVRRGDHDDGRLLAALSQGGYQPPLPVRLADSQMFPAPVQLVKFQLHRRLRVQYGSGWNWSFRAAGEVCRKVSKDQ